MPKVQLVFITIGSVLRGDQSKSTTDLRESYLYYTSQSYIWRNFDVFSGSVKVWDPRQKNEPVATMEPGEGETRRDCWTVAFGVYL